ncbi:MAG: alcohol dehydrogenase catalytic domain-containing protein [Acidobacteriota bacterium]
MSKSLSRRKLFQKSLKGAAAGGFLLAPQVAAGQAPAQVANAQAGRKFKAMLRFGTGTMVEELKLLPIQEREVVIRTEASAVCYTITGGALATTNARRASIPNHSGMGVVEAIGPGVRRVQVGDRVIIPGTPQCGVCYMCLQGRADWCQFLGTSPAHPVAEMADGTPVFEDAALGGLSEVMVVTEEYCCPVFTQVPGAELCLLGDTVGTGLAAAHNLAPIEPGTDVVVLGAGPVGMGAIQGARMKTAARVIVVEPIKYRRDIAMKVGATMVLDPNVEGAGLVAKIQDMCKGPTDRRFAGGRSWNAADRMVAVPPGPDYTIEAVGGEYFPPKVEQSPDPTGVLPINQAFQFTRGGGHIIMLGFALRGTVSFPAWEFQNRGRTFHSGQQGGLQMLRDLPRYVRLIEKGEIDTKAMVTATYPLERAREAIQAVADRTTLGAVITFS